MDKTVLRNFAIESRKDLMKKIDRKIKLFYVDEDFKKENRGDVIVLSNDKHTLTLTKEEDSNRDKLLRRIVELGYEQVIEEAAYTWFNRLISIRYMEINDYLPLTVENQSLSIRVLSSQDNTLFPEILKFTNLTNNELDIDFDKNKHQQLDNDDKKFKYILLLICKKLGKIIPQVFDGVTDYIDLLIPDNLLSNGSVLDKLINIPENNFKNVEVIGWLYQYYNQTEKEKVMNKKGTYTKNEIPYVTQLFTPDWIVKYMVENSLGRYWIENGGNENLIFNWKYFIKDNIEKTNNKKQPTDIKCIDPCSGSGHILVYMFEVLYQIYESYGYNKKEIAELILKNNLYGLDIDDRAGQLSILSVILKAREYDKSIFNKDIIKNLNVMAIQDSKNIDRYVVDSVPDSIKEKVNYLVDTFIDAKEIGSLLIVKSDDYNDIYEYLKENNMETLLLRESIIQIIKESNILSDKYDVVVTNPPYLLSAKMSNVLKQYVKKNYVNSKMDLCTAFIETKLVNKNRYLGMINMQSWMFLTSFEGLRKQILNEKKIISLLQLGPHAFDDIGGEVVQTSSFILKNSSENNISSIYYRLVSFQTSKQKELAMLSEESKYIYNINSLKLKKLPGCRIIYWIGNKYFEIFKESKKLGDIIPVKKGVDTGNNDKYLRLWHEVEYNNIKIGASDSKEVKTKWVPYNKGGEFRKWYGNIWYVINWENDGFELKHSSANLRSPHLYFKNGVTWSALTSLNTSFRYSNYGAIFDSSGSSMFGEDKNLYYLGLCNSNVIRNILNFTNPTLNFGAGTVSSIPVKFSFENSVENIVKNNIELSKADWDSFETSWNFKEHPLVRLSKNLWDETVVEALMQKYYGTQGKTFYPLELCWKLYNGECHERFYQLKQNEEELNRIFIDIYGLQDELLPEEEDKDVTIRKASKLRDIKSLISYAVGCMFGRYSLDEEGLVFAGGEFDINRYNKFIPDNDNIIPMSDNANVYYNDDIVGKFKEFIKVTFGTDTLNENLDYIAETLGKKGTESSEDTIRRYFINEFYNDHLKMYQKRPIYWLFDSGKKNGFKCLVYLHRYDEQIVSKIRTKYLHNTISIYQRTLEEIDYKLNNEELNTIDKRKLQNRKSDLNSKITECNEYEEMVGNVANKMIKLDLDDGVVVNYGKFIDDNGKSILAKIK